MQGNWIEVKVITTAEAIEPVSGIFYGLDVKGVAIEDPNDILQREQGPLTWDFADINILEYGSEAATVTGYFSEEEDMESTVNYIKDKLEELRSYGFDIGKGKIIHKFVNEKEWADTWKKYYKPTRIGDSIVVKPIWEDFQAQDKDIIIELDPGMAFGTGTHETTRMCIKALEKYVHKDATVFDIGTGSGILAITAAKLGAKKVIGVDLDPVAVDSAKENVGYNNISNIEVLYGNLMDVVQGKAEIVVANIIAEIIVILTDDVKKSLLPGGYFITSGIIRERKDLVVDKLTKEGFSISEIYEEGEWLCIIASLNA